MNSWSRNASAEKLVPFGMDIGRDKNTLKKTEPPLWQVVVLIQECASGYR